MPTFCICLFFTQCFWSHGQVSPQITEQLCLTLQGSITLRKQVRSVVCIMILAVFAHVVL